MHKTRYSFAILGLAVVGASLALAQAPSRDAHPGVAAQQQPPAGEMPQLPPGWTEADVQACMEAGTPGEMHAFLAEGVGVWQGKSKMWMAPGAPAVDSECNSTVTAIMDGRFFKCEMAGEMPGMGPFNGFGLYGYDNAAETFQSTWIDNCGTTMAMGKGERASDGRSITWNYTYTCPLTRKPTTLREIERITGKDTRTMEIYGIDPKSGKEFKMMEIAFTRKPGTAAAASANTTR